MKATRDGFEAVEATRDLKKSEGMAQRRWRPGLRREISTAFRAPTQKITTVDEIPILGLCAHVWSEGSMCWKRFHVNLLDWWDFVSTNENCPEKTRKRARVDLRLNLKVKKSSGVIRFRKKSVATAEGK
jgi:hypothetical protein